MATGALNRASLEAKDRDALVAIASALGVRAGDDTDTSALIDRILERAPEAPASGGAARGRSLGADGEPLADWEIELAEHEGTPIAPDARRASEGRGERRDTRRDIATIAVTIAVTIAATIAVTGTGAPAPLPTRMATGAVAAGAAAVEVVVADSATRVRRATTATRPTTTSR